MLLVKILLGVVALAVAVAVHECGHLIAGIAVGFRFSFFAIGPLLVERSPSGSITFGWNRVPEFFGGVAATLPVTGDGLRRRFAIVVAGGPCASLVLAAVAALLLVYSPAAPAPIRIEWSWLRLLSAAIFLGSAVPLRNGSFVTDGLRLCRILAPGPAGERELGLLALTAAEASGVRPRDWDPAMIRKGLGVRDGSIVECQMHLYAYMHALDSGAPDAAGASLESALALVSRGASLLREQCRVEAAYFEAAQLGQPSRARSLLESVPAGAAGVRKADRLRAEAAIAIAEGDAQRAATLVSAALACSPA